MLMVFDPLPPNPNPNIKSLTKCVRIVKKHSYLMDQCFYLKNNPNMAITPSPPPPSEHCSDCDAHRCLWTVPYRSNHSSSH